MTKNQTAAPMLRAMTPADYDAVLSLWQASEGIGLNESDTREGIAKCNIFLFANNAAGRAFWLREGWSPREDLVLVQKAISAS